MKGAGPRKNGRFIAIPLEKQLVYTEAESGCWEFAGSRRGDGYGRIFVQGRNLGAHRVAAHAWLGFDLSDKRIIMHICDNPICINPAHLRVGSQKENILDAVSKRRHSKSAQTHCKHGHLLEGSNLRLKTLPNGRVGRECRACHRQDSRNARIRKKLRATDALEQMRITHYELSTGELE